MEYSLKEIESNSSGYVQDGVKKVEFHVKDKRFLKKDKPSIVKLPLEEAKIRTKSVLKGDKTRDLNEFQGASRYHSVHLIQRSLNQISYNGPPMTE